MSEQDTTLRNYGTGAGLAIGVGLAATTATVAGTDVAMAAGYGAAGGLVVGAFASRLAASSLDRDDWMLRVTAGTLLVALAVGALLGALTAWTIDASLVDGATAGGAAGGVLAVLLTGILVAAGRKRQDTTRDAPPQTGKLHP